MRRLRKIEKVCDRSSMREKEEDEEDDDDDEKEGEEGALKWTCKC